MNCLFNFQRSSPVPPRNLPAVSQGVSETALRQDISFRSGEQRIGLSKQAQAAQAAFMSAKRHVPSAALKLTNAQMGQPNILRSPFTYPPAVDVLRGICQEEQQRQQTELQHSHAHQQALQSPQSIRHDQVHQEVLCQSVVAKEGGRGQQHAVCQVAKAHNNDQGYVGQQLGASSGSACARPSPQAQQVSSPAACGRFYSRNHQQQQSESVFNGCAPREVTPFTGRANEQTKQQALSWPNDPASSQNPLNARSACITSPRNPSPFENTFYLYMDPAAGPSCHRQLTHDAGANCATGRSPSVSEKLSLLVGGDSSCHAISVPENCAVPLHASMAEAHGKKHCGRPGTAAIPSRNESFNSSKHDTTGRVRFVTEAEQGGLQGTSGMIANASPLTSLGRAKPESTGGCKKPSTRTDGCPSQLGNGLFGFCRVSPTPQRQVGGTGQHVWVQGMRDYTKRNHRAALFPLRGGNTGGENFAQQFIFRGLQGRMPQDAYPRQELTVPSSTQGQSAAGLVCGVADTQKRSREEEAKRYLSAALGDLPGNVGGKRQAEHRQCLVTEHRPNVSDAPTCTPLRKAEENVDMYSINRSVSAGAAVPTAGQQATGFPMRRPRTPLRHAREPHMTQSYLQSPRQPQPLHTQEQTQHYSDIYEQLRLQKQLCQLRDQHPYSWAATGMPIVGYGSPLMLRRGNLGAQLPFGPHEQRANAGSCLSSAPATRWEPRSPEFRQIEPASTHLSEEATMVCNQTSGTVPADSAGCSRKYQQQRPSFPQKTFIKGVLQKRPTSAPPGQNELRPSHIGAVAQSHTQRPPTSSLASAALANRKGIPWTNQYFPTYVLQHRKEPMAVSPLRAISHQQPPLLRGASPLLSSLKPAFLSASRVVAPQAAGTTEATATVQPGNIPELSTPEVTGNFESSHSESPALANVCEDSRQLSAPTAGTQDAGGRRANTAEQHQTFCTAVSQSTETAPFVASAEERASISTNATSSITRNATSLSAGRRYSNSETGENMPSHSGTVQKNEAEVPVPCDIKPPLPGEPHLYVSMSAAGAPPCTAPEHEGPSKFLLHSSGVGLGGFSDVIHRDATPQQQQLQPRQHPRSVSICYGDTVDVLTKDKQHAPQERQGYEVKQMGRLETVLSSKSATRVSFKQPRDYLLKKDQEGRTRLQQSLEGSSKQHFLQEEQRGPSREEENYLTPDQMGEQPTQRQSVQRDPVRLLSAIEEASSEETRSLQTRENKDWGEKEALHMQKHARLQTNHVIPQERPEDEIRSAFMQAGKQHMPEESCSANVIRSSGKDTVTTKYVTQSLCSPDVSDVNKRVTAADKTPLTPLENAYLSAVRSAARSGAIVGALAAALRCAASTDVPECVPARQVASPISKVRTSLESAKTSSVSKTDEDPGSRKSDKNRDLLQKLPVCEHQAREAVPNNTAASLNELSDTLSDPRVGVDARAHKNPMLPRLDTADKEIRDDAPTTGLGDCFKARERRSCQKTFSSHSSKYDLSCPSPDCVSAAELHEKGAGGIQEIRKSDNIIASASPESANGRRSSGMVDCDTGHTGASRDVCTSDVCTITEEKTDEYKSTDNKAETPSVRAMDRSVLVTSQCELSEPLGRDVNRSRMQSIVSSTDTSICTGYSTTTNSNLGSTEEGTFSDRDNDGTEDVIPLPSFLWRSPRSFVKNDPRGRHSLQREAACTASDVGSLDRPMRHHNTEQGVENSLDKGVRKTHAPAATKENNFRNNHIISRCSSEGDGRGRSSSADMQLEDFELADPRFGGEASLLGRGTYGVVRLMRHKPTGRLYAVKSIEKSSVVEAGMVSQVEFELLTQKDVLRHRNVLRCHAFLEDIDRVHMILEYCSGGDLYTRIRTQPMRRISEQEAFLYFAQLVNGLHYMHTRCVMHRDLKLENLLLDKDGVLKIADLGWCTTILGKRRNFNFCGTLDYLAPEMIRGDGHDWRVDLWGAGILLYEMLDGKPPFQSTRHLELVQQILKAKINLPAHIPPDAGNLIQQLLQYDPEDRIPLHAICQHPWVKRMWNQLKRHYYKIYPEAAPAAFDLCSPMSTARTQVAGTLSWADGSKRRVLDLREIYPVESAGTSKGEGVTDDGDDNKTRRPGKPHSLSTDNKQRHIIGVLQSTPLSNAALSNSSHGPAVATTAKTHADGGGGKPDARLAHWPTIGDGVATVRKNLGDTTKLSERVETHRRSASSPAKDIPGPVSREERALSRGTDSERKALCSWNSSIHSTEVASNGLQHHHVEDSVHISIECTESESSVHETLRQKPQGVTPDAGLVDKKESADDRGIPSNTHQRASDGGPSGANEQQPVDCTESLQAGMLPDEGINRHATVAKRETSEVVYDEPNTPGKATGSSTSGVESKEKSCISMRASSSTAAASPVPQDEEIALLAAASIGYVSPQTEDHLSPADAPVSSTVASSSATRAVTPRVTRLAPRIKDRRSPAARETTSAPPRRRTTATAAAIEKILEAATAEGEGLPLTSRETANTCPRRITPGNMEEHCISSVNSVPHMHIKPKRPGGPRRPKSSQPLSKIDSGLGSQKQILLAPPVKRSALRACEPSDSSVSNELKESEESEIDTTTKHMWTSVSDENSGDSSTHTARPDLHMSVPHKEMQPVTSLNISPHLQHIPHLSRPVQQPQQLQQCCQQVQPPAAPSEKGAEYRICEPSRWRDQKEDTSQPYQNSTIQHQPLTRTGEAPYDCLQVHRQRSLFDHQSCSGHQQQQPLLYRTSAGEHDPAAASSHQFSLEQHHMFPVSSCNSKYSSPERRPADLVHHSQRLQQQQQLAQQTEAQSVQQGASPVNYCQPQHQLAGNSLVPLKSRMVSSQPSSPWASWYLPTPQQHTREQQRRLYGQTPYVGSEHQTSAKAVVLHGSPRHPLQGQQLQQQYMFSQQPTQQSLASMQQRLRQQQANSLYPPSNQQLQGKNQETPMDPFSLKEVPSVTLACRSMSRRECRNVANPVNLHQQSYGATFYAVDSTRQPLRSMTPPAPSSAYRSENAANAAHIRSYQLLPHQQKMPLYPLMSPCMRDQVVHTEGRTDAFYKCMAEEEYRQCGGGGGASQACTIDISGASPGASEKPIVVSNAMGHSASTDAAGTTIDSPPSTLAATGTDDALLSSADLETCTGDAGSHGLKPQNNYGHGGFTAKAAGDTAAGHQADSHATDSAATSSTDIASNTLANSQGICQPLELKGCIPYNALHAYTPRWGRGWQAAVDRSASVVPSSVLSPLVSATDLRSLLAVSAPPRSYAKVTRNQPSGLPLSGQSEQHPQQHRQQVQPTRQHERSEMPVRSHQEHQQRVPNQRAAVGTVISACPEAHQAAKEECRSQARINTREQQNLIRKQRLSCFSFGHTQENSRHLSEENTNSTSVALFSDRLSAGSANDVGLLSQRLHVPDANRSGHSPVVPSSKAQLVLSELFESSKLPRPTKPVGARLLARTQGSRHRGGRSALATRTSAASGCAPGSRVSNGSSGMLPRRSLVGMPPKASNTSASKPVCCRLRKGGSRSRLRAQSPPMRGDSTAAVAAAAAAWRARTAESDPRERKMPTAETSVKESRTVGGNLRQTVLRSGETVRSGTPMDSSLRKRGIRETRGGSRLEALSKSRIGRQGVAEGDPRKAETYSAAVPATSEGNCACPSDSPQAYAIAARLENRAGERVSLTQSYSEKGDRGTALALSPLGTSSIRDTPGVGKSFEETVADPHANRNNESRQTSTDHSDRLIGSIAGYMSHHAERGDTATVAEKSDNVETNVSASLCMHALTAPRGEKAQLQQQRQLLSMTASSGAKCSQSAESVMEQLNPTNIPNGKTVQPTNFDVMEKKYESGSDPELDAVYPYGVRPFQAGMQHCPQSFISRVQALHSTSASPSKRLEHFSVLHKGQASNTSTGLPGHPLAAAAAVATTKKPACVRYWSPPTRDLPAVQWRSCSNGRMEGPFFSRQAPPQAMSSFSFCSPALRVGSDEKRNQHQSTALHQINNYASTSGVPTSALTSSWTANQRQRYTTRQQTPTLGTANVAGDRMRQATPLCLPVSGGQQQLYRALHSPHVPILSVGSNIGGPPSTHDNTAGRKFDHPPSFPGFWGSAAIAGVSAAASTAACHAGLSRGHVHPGSGIRLLSFSSQG